jgi:LysR family carnitine catabolism transcriptional activator
MKWTDLNLNNLQYFVDAIEFGSLTKAAEKNFVSRPAISQAIRRIEETIGHDLIVHAKNRLELTDKGRSFYQKAKKSINLFVETISELKESSREINLACSATLAEFLVLPALSKMKLGPSSQIRIHIATTSGIRQLIKDGKADVGLLINDDKTYGFDSSVISKGNFVLRSKSGEFVEPIITTGPRPEVTHLMKILKKKKQVVTQHFQIESWAICRQTMEALGGTCLVPDLIPAKSYKTVSDFKYKYEYEILAIYKDINTLRVAEIDLLRKLQV